MLAMPKRRQATQFKNTIKMTSFSHFKDKDIRFDSPPFLTSSDGYEMYLQVHAAGHSAGSKGTHISTFLYLKAGENDDLLDWPMRGRFTVELLNQERDENHKLATIHFAETAPTNYNSRVRDGHVPVGFGLSKFISHEDLEGESLPPHTQYLKDDTLYFRVNMTEMDSSSKPWLAGAIS